MGTSGQCHKAMLTEFHIERFLLPGYLFFLGAPLLGKQ